MFAVDTNILIYAHFDRYPQHAAARRFCRERLLGRESWCFSWQVVYEYLRITTHPRVHARPLTAAQAMKDLEPYLSSPGCEVLGHTPAHRSALETVLKGTPSLSGNLLFDCHYASLLLEHGVSTIYTADADFRRFPHLKVVDPTQGGPVSRR